MTKKILTDVNFIWSHSLGNEMDYLFPNMAETCHHLAGNENFKVKKWSPWRFFQGKKEPSVFLWISRFNWKQKARFPCLSNLISRFPFTAKWWSKQKWVSDDTTLKLPSDFCCCQFVISTQVLSYGQQRMHFFFVLVCFSSSDGNFDSKARALVARKAQEEHR